MHATAATMTTSTMPMPTTKTSTRTMRRKHAPMRATTTTTRAVKTASQTTLKRGVVTGQDMIDVLDHARENGYAIPAVNCTMSPVINACLEAAKEANAPMIVQFSNGGGYFMAGKGTSNENQKAAVAGCVAGALMVRELADLYGVPVILHTDHCAKNLLRGSTACWRRTRSITRNTVNRCFRRTCWI